MTERIGYVRENLAPQGQSLSGRDVELFLLLFSLKIHYSNRSLLRMLSFLLTRSIPGFLRPTFG